MCPNSAVFFCQHDAPNINASFKNAGKMFSAIRALRTTLRLNKIQTCTATCLNIKIGTWKTPLWDPVPWCQPLAEPKWTKEEHSVISPFPPPTPFPLFFLLGAPISLPFPDFLFSFTPTNWQIFYWFAIYYLIHLYLAFLYMVNPTASASQASMTGRGSLSKLPWQSRD